jgi:hypothetical protein
MVVAGMGAAQGPFGADLRFEAVEVMWQGLGEGHGVARGRQVGVQLSGRRVPRPRCTQLWLPAPDGQVRAVPPVGPVTIAEPVVALRRTG